MAGVDTAMRQLSAAGTGLSRSGFERDGFAALEGFFAPHKIDLLGSAIRRLLARRPGEVVVDSLQNGRRTFWSQAANRETRYFRFNDLHLMSQEVRDVALDFGLAQILEDLLGEPAVLCSSLSYEKGSSETKHVDSLHMTPRTPHAMIAVSIALEDVHPSAGPLVYYPGSHRIPLYTFNDGTHHATREESADWFDYIDVQIRLRGLKEKAFLARKGDVFIWHADLVHGGRPVMDHGRTRGTLDCHYFTEGDCLARGADVVPMNGAYWIHRLPQAVTVDPAAFGPESPFPEETYLRRHPDVRECVEARVYPSGERHYRDCGFREGRGV